MNKDKRNKEAEQAVVDYVDKTLRNNFIKNIMIGFTSANQMILNYINDGHDIEDVKTFCENNLKKKNKKIMEKVIGYSVEDELKETKGKAKKTKKEV